MARATSKSHGWLVLKQAGQCHMHCFKLLCWERGLGDVAVVSQCGAGSRSGEIFRRSSGVQSKLQGLSGSRISWASEVFLGLAFLHFDCLRFDCSCAHWLHLVCGGCFLQLYCSQIGFIFIHPLLCLLTYKNKALASAETSRQIQKYKLWPSFTQDIKSAPKIRYFFCSITLCCPKPPNT